MIRTALYWLGTVLAGPFLLIGVIWSLQGVGILPGSFMTGDIKWTLIGVPLAIAGIFLTWWLNRGR